MVVLALDTCLDACVVALVDLQGHALAQQSRTLTRGHTECLAPMVQQCLHAAKTDPAAISRVAVTTGPGSFTGQRVGLAFARGFVIGTAIPVIGITTLELLAAQLRAGERLHGTQAKDFCIHVAIDARRGQVYGQSFDYTGVPLCAAFVAAPQDAVTCFKNCTGARAAIWAGSGVALLHLPDTDNIASDVTQSDPVILGRLAQHKEASARSPEAVYLRPADATPARSIGF